MEPPRRRAARPSASMVNALLDEAADHYRAGRMETAAALYRRAEALDPDDDRANYSLAVIDLRATRFEDARRRLRLSIRRRTGDAATLHNLGVSEQALGGWAAAAKAYERALALNPKATHTRVNLAIAQAVLGRTEAAIAHHRVLAADPAERPSALARLAALRPGAVTDNELGDIRADLANGALDADRRIGLLFALGAVLESRGDDANAFDAFTAGNALKHQTLSTGDARARPAVVASEHERSIARIRALFTQAFIAAHSGDGDPAARPIFVLGMPRSGTSLVEQILASHPRVQGLGESDALSEAANGRFPYPPEAPKGPSHFRDLARRYLEAQRRRGWPPDTRLVDKTLDNHLHVGLIHLMFPRATILHVVRDPMDTGLACYRQLFASGNETLYDLAGIGAEWRRYREMISHWGAVLPGRVVEVGYEALVENPDVEIRNLVTETCGLTWSPDCLRFHESRRAVGSASADQVRRPLFATSIGRWRRHEARLAPLAAALAGAPDTGHPTNGDSDNGSIPVASPAANRGRRW